MKTLNEIQEHLRTILPQGIDLTIEAAKAELVEESDKYKDLILLESRYRHIGRQLLQGVITHEESQMEFNKIRKDLMEFIDTLQASQLAGASEVLGDDLPDIYNGEVFYRIPNRMQLEQEVKCLVRLAFDRQIIMEGLEIEEGDVLKDLRISEVMGVELLDTHGEYFSIRTLNDTVQFVDKDLVTEWIFNVTPTAIGTHPLTLKISIIEMRDGIERKRNVVMEEQIVVVTEAVAEEAEMKQAAAGLQVGQAKAPTNVPGKSAESVTNVSPSPAPKPAPSPAPKPKGKPGRKLARALAGVLAIVVASWAAITGGLFDFNTTDPIVVVDPVISVPEYWNQVRKEDTRDAYEDFVATVDDGEFDEYRVKANERLLEMEDEVFQIAMLSETVEELSVYLQEYPKGRYVEEVMARIREIEEGEEIEEPEEPEEPEETEKKPSSGGSSKIPARVEAERRRAERRKVKREQLIREKEEREEEARRKAAEEEGGKPRKEPAITIKRTSRKPIYPGCEKRDKRRKKEEQCTEDEIRGFMEKRLSYPDEAKRKRIEGVVKVTFVVEKDGRVTEVQAVKGLGGGCEEEAVRLVKQLPKFKPGLNQSGAKARVKYTLPVRFSLQ